MNEFYHYECKPIEMSDIYKTFGMVLFFLCLLAGYLFQIEEDRKHEEKYHYRKTKINRIATKKGPIDQLTFPEYSRGVKIKK